MPHLRGGIITEKLWLSCFNWAREGIFCFFFFVVGTDLDWGDHCANKRCLHKWSQLLKMNWVFPLYSIFCSYSDSPSLIPLVLFKNPVKSTASRSFQINWLVMAVYPEYRSHYVQRKLNMSDRKNGHRQITVALSLGIDWKNIDVSLTITSSHTDQWHLFKRHTNWMASGLKSKNLCLQLRCRLSRWTHPRWISSTVFCRLHSQEVHLCFRKVSQPVTGSLHQIWGA